MSVQIERRYLQELRAAESESMTLTGYAAKFNSPSSIAGKFRETMRLARSLVRLLRSRTFASCLITT